MNLYKLHTDPKQLVHHDEQYKIPRNAWNTVRELIAIKSSYDEIKPYEKYIKNGDMASYFYAYVYKGRWPEGEEAILNGDPRWAWQYAKYVLDGPWPEGEALIRTNDRYSKEYDMLLKKHALRNN